MRMIVLIPTAARPQLLERTLTSLSQCKFPKEYVQTIVIENGPACGVAEIVHSMDSQLRFEYRHTPIPNKSLALNSVLEELTDELVIFFDDDVRLSPGILYAYVQEAINSPGKRVLGGPLKVDYEVEPAEWLKLRLPPSASGWDLSVSEDLDHPVLSGANWAAYAADMKRLGGFDEDRGPGALTGSTGQETNMQSRLYADGSLGVYVPKAIAWHYVPAERCSAEWTIRRAYRYGIAHGLDFDDGSVRMLGMPRWLLRKWLSIGAKFLKTRMSRDEEKRFLAARDLRWFSGVLKGTRLAAKETERNL